MTERSNHRILLRTLQELYIKISMKAFNVRSGIYRQFVKKGQSLNVTAVLTRKIEQLVAEVDGKNSLDKIVTSVETYDSNTEIEPYSTDSSVDDAASSPGIGSGMARRIENRRGSLAGRRAMGHRLKESAWMHIHSALRHANQGDADAAKLHATIAGHAIEEAQHHLSDEEYTELVRQIEEYFGKEH